MIDAAAEYGEHADLWPERVDHMVYVAREPDAIRVGATRDLFTLAERLGDATLLATIPGEQPLEHWFHRRYAIWHVGRERYTPHRDLLADVEGFRGEASAAARDCGTNLAGVLAAVRRRDPVFRDLERAWLAGTSLPDLARVAGADACQLRRDVRVMRSLGFALPYRR